MAKTLISTVTASSSSLLEFTSGINSTYDVYEFVFINMHPSSNSVNWTFQVNAGGGSGFNETMQTTYFEAYNEQGGASSGLSYGYWADQANGTSYQILTDSQDNSSSSGISGVLTLFAPSSTTFLTHFSCVTNGKGYGPFSMNNFVSGYINTTYAVDEISFKYSSGNIDAGTIKMFGVS